MNKNISRRDFIKAAAVSGLGVAAASVLGGCAKKTRRHLYSWNLQRNCSGNGKNHCNCYLRC